MEVIRCDDPRLGLAPSNSDGPCADDAAPEEERIRGFRLVRRATEALRFDQPRLYYVPAGQSVPVTAEQ